jgi:hypothetical protein
MTIHHISIPMYARDVLLFLTNFVLFKIFLLDFGYIGCENLVPVINQLVNDDIKVALLGLFVHYPLGIARLVIYPYAKPYFAAT